MTKYTLKDHVVAGVLNGLAGKSNVFSCDVLEEVERDNMIEFEMNAISELEKVLEDLVQEVGE